MHRYLPLLVLLAACGTAEPELPASTVVSDSGGVRLVINSGALTASTEMAPSALAPVTGDPVRPFERVSGAALLSGGEFAVSDLGLTTIIVFDSTGKELRRFGVKGSGAGEFRELSWIGSCTGETILAADHYDRKVLEFDRNGTLLGSQPIPQPVAGTEHRLAGCIDEQTVLVSTNLIPNELFVDLTYDTSSYFSHRLRTDSVVPVFTNLGLQRRVLGRLGIHVQAVPVPFGTANRVTTGNGQIYLTSNQNSDWLILGVMGDTVGIMREEAANPSPVTRVDLESYVNRSRDTIISTLDRDSLESNVYRAGADSVHKPFWDAIADQRTGHLLVKVADRSRERWHWVLYDRDGRRLGAVVNLPADLEPQALVAGTLLAIRPGTERNDSILKIQIAYDGR